MQRLDRRDIAILSILQEDGRITNQALAQRISLSPSACLERLRRLEASGIIKGYRAEVVLERVVRSTAVFVEVTLKSHEASDFARFEQAVQEIPEVVECHAIGGGSDYLLKVEALDIAHYQSLIDALLEARIGIGRYFTYVVTKAVKESAGHPIEHLIDKAGGDQA